MSDMSEPPDQSDEDEVEDNTDSAEGGPEEPGLAGAPEETGQAADAFEWVDHDIVFYPGAEKTDEGWWAVPKFTWEMTAEINGKVAVAQAHSYGDVADIRLGKETCFVDDVSNYQFDRFRLDVAVDDFPANREAAFREILTHLTVEPFAGEKPASSPVTFMAGVGRLRPREFEELAGIMRNYVDAEKKLVGTPTGGRPNSFKNGYNVALAGMVAWLKEKATNGKAPAASVANDLAKELMAEHQVTDEQLLEIAKNIPIGGMEDIDRLQRKRIESEIAEVLLNMASRVAENESEAKIRGLLADHGDPGVMQHAVASLHRAVTIPVRQGFGIRLHYDGPKIPIAFMRVVMLGGRRRVVQ